VPPPPPPLPEKPKPVEYPKCKVSSGMDIIKSKNEDLLKYLKVSLNNRLTAKNNS
jgi:hypothetical protein